MARDTLRQPVIPLSAKQVKAGNIPLAGNARTEDAKRLCESKLEILPLLELRGESGWCWHIPLIASVDVSSDGVVGCERADAVVLH